MAKFDMFIDATGVDDLDFSNGIDFRWTETILESLTQRLQLRYEVWTGQWGYNLQFGTPYRELMQQGLNKQQLDAEFIRIALQEEDVTSVKIINSVLNNVTRRYEIQSLEVYTDGGLLEIPISNPYTKTNSYPEPIEISDFTFCQKTDQEIEDYNKLYEFINFTGLPEFGDSTWWNKWGGNDPYFSPELITAINNIYGHVNFDGLPDSGDSYWSSDWGGTDPI